MLWSARNREIDVGHPAHGPADFQPGGFSHDARLGLHAQFRQKRGALAQQLLVRHCGHDQTARQLLPAAFQPSRRPHHGGQSALHVHRPPPVEPAIFNPRFKRVSQVILHRMGVRVPVKEQRRSRTASPQDPQYHRPSVPDLIPLHFQTHVPKFRLNSVPYSLFRPGHAGDRHQPLQQADIFIHLHLVPPTHTASR